MIYYDYLGIFKIRPYVNLKGQNQSSERVEKKELLVISMETIIF